MAISGPGYLRGRAEDEVTAAVARALGRSLALRAEPGAKFVVGSDQSEASEALKVAFAEGLLQRPLDVVDLGVVAAPLVAHAQRRVDAIGVVFAGGAKLSKGHSALAWRFADQMPTPEELFAASAAQGDCAAEPEEGRGLAARSGRSTAAEVRKPRALDVSFDYVAHLQWLFVDAINSAVDVVVAAEQPEWTRIARRYLQAVFPLGLFTAVERQSSRAGRSIASGRCLTAELADGVYRHRADMGLVLGEHLDRLEIVDDQGVPLSPDESAWLLMSSYGGELRGEAVVLDDRLSTPLDEAVASWGGRAVRHCGDPNLLPETMRRSGALIGFDLDGRVFFRDLNGEGDAMLAACRLIAFVGKQISSLGSIRNDCPPMPASPEVLLPLPENATAADLFACIERQWPAPSKATISADWGLVVRTPSARVRLQPSHYREAISIRFEAAQHEEMVFLADCLCRAVPAELADALVTRTAAIF